MEIVSIRANSDAIDTEKSMELKTLTAIPHHSESTSTKLKVEEDVHNEPEQIRRNCWVRSVESVEVWAEKFLASYRQVILAGLKVVTALLYLAFVCYSWYYRFGDEGSIILLVITAFLAFRMLIRVLNRCGVTSRVKHLSRQPLQKISKLLIYVRWFLYPLTTLGVGLYIGLVVIPSNPENIRSLIGLASLIAISFIFSFKASRVDWHPVFWGFILQICVAIFTLRIEIGYSLFLWLGDAVQTFIQFSDSGAEFVFGAEFKTWGFLFTIAGVLVFFNSITFVLLHLGVIDTFVRVAGRSVAFCLGTGPVESLVAITNIFLGLSEVTLLIRPYLPSLSLSELCAIMTCGFASVSMALMSSFIINGAPANHLLTAAVISAPAALAFSKLVWPETTKVDRTAQARISMQGNAENRTILSAMSEGAMAAAGMVSGIMTTMIAFFSIVTMFDKIFQWMGQRVGIDDLTFETLSGYLLYPLSYSMGVHPDDCFAVGALIGVKMFATPIVAFYELGKIIQNREAFEAYLLTNGTWHQAGRDIILEATNTTLVKGIMQVRTEVISTYAISGLSAFTGLAISIGGYFALCPERKADFIKVSPYAFFAGNVACFATGAVAGLMYVDQ